MADVEESFQELAAQLDAAKANEEKIKSLEAQLEALRSQFKENEIAKEALVTDYQSQLRDIKKEKEIQGRKVKEHQQKLQRFKKDIAEKSQQADTLKAAQSEAEKENELLLLQLHQVQEELEQVFLKHKESEAAAKKEAKAKEQESQRVGLLEKQLSEANKVNVDQTKRATDFEAQFTAATRVKNELIAQVEERQKAIAETKKAKEKLDGLVSELKSKQAELEQQVKIISQQSDNKAKLADELKSQCDQAESRNNELEKQLSQLALDKTDLEQENELLLLQLHHVQEELEHYFLKYQELESQPAKTGLTVQRLELQESYELDGYSELKWFAERVRQSSRTLDTVHFKLASHGGTPALVVRPQNTEEQTMLNWPDAMEDEHGSRLLIKPSDTSESNLKVLNHLSPADWALVNGLLDETITHLMSNSAVLPGEAIQLDRAAWLQLAGELQASLQAMPPVLRFSNVAVREVYQTDGYEHIWLSFSDLVYENYQYDEYAFKLVLKDMQSDGKPATVALVFRDLDDGQAPLRVWPPHTEDQFGPLLNIGFDVASGQPDSVWDDLWAVDRQFLSQLITILPDVVRDLENKGTDFGDRSSAELEKLLQTVVNSLSASKAETAIESVNDGASEDGFFWGSVSLTENYRAGRYAHLGLKVKDLKFDGMHWAEYEFKLFARKLDDGLKEAWAGLEFRVLENGLAPLLHWSPTLYKEDEHGAYMVVEADYPQQGLHDQDKQLVERILAVLPLWLKTLDSYGEYPDPNWSVWQSLILPLSDQVCESTSG